MQSCEDRVGDKEGYFNTFLTHTHTVCSPNTQWPTPQNGIWKIWKNLIDTIYLSGLFLLFIPIKYFWKIASILLQGTHLILLNAHMDTYTHLLFPTHTCTNTTEFHYFTFLTVGPIVLSSSPYIHLNSKKEKWKMEIHSCISYTGSLGVILAWMTYDVVHCFYAIFTY